MFSNNRKNFNPCNIPFPCAFPPASPPTGVLAYSFSEPIPIFTTPPPLTVTNTETEITTVNINTPQKTLIELRGLVGWSASITDVMIWRIRRGIGGPIIWEGHDGVGVDSRELSGHISSILHVDSNAALFGTNIYQLTAQVDPTASPGRTTNINGPIVFAATAYSI